MASLKHDEDGKNVKSLRLVHVAAFQDSDRGLGQQQSLLYRLDADMQHFKKLTWGHIVMMGRKTYESVGRLLPGRVNVVLTRNVHYVSLDPQAVVFADCSAALVWCQQHHPEKTVFIIGGGQLYEETLRKGLVSELYLTEIEGDRPADTFYPDFPSELWHCTSRSVAYQQKDHIEQKQVEFRFLHFVSTNQRPPERE
jgi:dihydrofolate reductase